MHPDPKPIESAATTSKVTIGSRSREGGEATGAIQLLRVEGDARNAATVGELCVLMANETRKLTRAGSVLVLSADALGRFAVDAASDVTAVDRTVPLFIEIERCIGRLEAESGLAAQKEFLLSAYRNESDRTLAAYPLQSALWAPLKRRDGSVFAGMLMLRQAPWTTAESVIAQRLAVSFAQSWFWLTSQARIRPRLSWRDKRVVVPAIGALVLSLVPTRLSSLAPCEIAPRDAVIVTAPMDGVIEDIPLQQNELVAPGAMLVRFADTNLRNRLNVADRELAVADARVKKTMLLAVTELRGRHELALARSEYGVKLAEHAHARDMFQRATILASASGTAVFGDKRDLIGKPVVTGERILEIADPQKLEVRIDLPASDAILLASSRKVKVFLDSDPMNPRQATIVRGEYRSKLQDSGVLAVRAIARLDDAGELPRLGIRGTAQVYGDRVPLIYFLLRKPWSTLRQWTGL